MALLAARPLPAALAQAMTAAVGLVLPLPLTPSRQNCAAAGHLPAARSAVHLLPEHHNQPEPRAACLRWQKPALAQPLMTPQIVAAAVAIAPAEAPRQLQAARPQPPLLSVLLLCQALRRRQSQQLPAVCRCWRALLGRR